MHPQESSSLRSYTMSTPLAIPGKQPPPSHVSALLAETRIPPRFHKARRKSSLACSSSPTSCSIRIQRQPRRQGSLFLDDSPDSLPESYSYLLTPPSSIPDLSRSVSSISIESDLSFSSSPSRTSRIQSPSRKPIDLLLENPLASSEIEIEEDGINLELSPARRRSSLNVLFGPLRTVAPRLRATSLVTSISNSLSSWATSLSAAQHDDYGLLPSHARMLPRPVNTSGPRPQNNMIDLEMERAPGPYTQPTISIELKPWSTSRPPRPREPRMNPDFLRILVLEQNMRKLGKISQDFGRARMILDPLRTLSNGSSRLNICITV